MRPSLRWSGAALTASAVALLGVAALGGCKRRMAPQPPATSSVQRPAAAGTAHASSAHGPSTAATTAAPPTPATLPRTIPVGVPGVGANWAPSAGCTLEPAKPAGFAPQKIQVSGGARAYSVYAPKGYDGRRALPLVFVLHGDGGDGNNIRKRFALEAAAKEGAIFVYPDGLGATWKQAEPDDTGADYAFFDELSRFVLGNYCVDPTHLFVAGFSSGAYMAHQLGCFRGGVVRAVAAVGGGGPYDAAGKHYDAQGELQCRANGAVSAMVVTGLNDNIVKPSEGQKSVEHWRKNLHCDATGTKSEQCVEYTHCLPNQRLRKCDMPGLGHDIAASTPAAVWSFFASFN